MRQPGAQRDPAAVGPGQFGQEKGLFRSMIFFFLKRWVMTGQQKLPQQPEAASVPRVVESLELLPLLQ